MPLFTTNEIPASNIEHKNWYLDTNLIRNCFTHDLPFVIEMHRSPTNSPYRGPFMRSFVVFNVISMKRCWISSRSWDAMTTVWRQCYAISVAELALNKPSWQQSSRRGGVASRANDGNSNSNFQAGSCTHTSGHTFPTSGVDLQIMSVVYFVEIQTRGDAPDHGKWMNPNTFLHCSCPKVL